MFESNSTRNEPEQYTHSCPVCGKEIPIEQDCCPECEFLYLQMNGGL